MSTETKEVKRRRSTSLPLLIGFLILGGLGFVFGEKIMTYIFYLQEVGISNSTAIKSKEAIGKPTLSTLDIAEPDTDTTSGSDPTSASINEPPK